MAEQKISVIRDGDTEIWVVTGKLEDGFAWQLPIYARPFRSDDGQRWFRVKRSGSYTSSQYRCLKPVLDGFDHCPKDPNAWWFREDTMLKVARKHPGINREETVVWPGYEPPHVDRGDVDAVEADLFVAGEPEFSNRETAFMKRAHARSGEVSWDAFKIIWLALRTEAARTLAVERKPLDLGFLQVIPLPYRINWKEALCVRFSGLFRAFRRPPTQRHDALTAAGVYGALSSVKLIALDSKKRFAHWTLEALPSEDLERAMEEQEFARFQRLAPVAYASWVLRAMSGCLASTLAVLKYYAAKVALPPAQKSEVRIGEVRLAPAAAGHVRPGNGLCETVELNPESAFDRFTDEADEKKEKAEKPPALPDLPNFLKNVKSFRQLVDNGEMKLARAKHDPGVIIELEPVISNPSPDPIQEANGP